MTAAAHRCAERAGVVSEPADIFGGACCGARTRLCVRVRAFFFLMQRGAILSTPSPPEVGALVLRRSFVGSFCLALLLFVVKDVQ